MTYSLMNPYPFKISSLHDGWVEFIARRHTVTPAQVLLRWALQMGAGVIPKSQNMNRITLNTKLFDFNLNQEEMQVLNSLSHLVSSPWNKPVSDDAFGIKDPDWSQPFTDFWASGQPDNIDDPIKHEHVHDPVDDHEMHATIVNDMEHK